jgi:hypothetical protein
MLIHDFFSHVQILVTNIRPFLCISLSTREILHALDHRNPHYFWRRVADGSFRDCVCPVWLLAGHGCKRVRWPSLESHPARNERQSDGLR